MSSMLSCVYKLLPTIQVRASFPDLSVALMISSGCIRVGHGPTIKVLPELFPHDRVPGVDWWSSLLCTGCAFSRMCWAMLCFVKYDNRNGWALTMTKLWVLLTLPSLTLKTAVESSVLVFHCCNYKVPPFILLKQYYITIVQIRSPGWLLPG